MSAKVEGLSSQEARERLAEYGKNLLPEKPPPSNISILVSQFKSPLVYVLFVAGVITFLLKEFADTAIISFAVLVNTFLGFVQEKKAGRALSALKQMIQSQCRVFRDGVLIKIDVSDLVPGDLVYLKQGEKIPADGEIIEASRLTVSEAVLTGESVPVKKSGADKVFQGTVVAAGAGKMKVVATGLKTEFGKIASSLQEEDEKTPFERQLAYFSKQLSLLILGLTLFVFTAGLITGKTISEIFTTSVALAVSAIPEGLLVALTVVLAVGMQRILSKQGLVRNLLSAETLGGVTTICTDKTGTLTEGKLEVVEVIGDKEAIIEQAYVTHDDPVMEPTLKWIKKDTLGAEKKMASLISEHERIDSIPFSPENRFFASLNRWSNSRNCAFINGAPDVILEYTNLDDEEKKSLSKTIEEYTGEGKRLIGIARKSFPEGKNKIEVADLKEGLEWMGLIVFFDPIRKGVKPVLEKFQNAGIKILLVTGDYAPTARTVFKELGIEVAKEDIILGEELEKISEKQVAEKLKLLFSNKQYGIFARTKPQQKLKIVEALKLNNEVVAMMGDGVNDAPALKHADIGVVVGSATDVAKESADLVLLDSDFKTVVEAIEEGRGIFDNLRKIVLFLLCDAFKEIVAVVGSIILRLPLPVTASQILWINIISDGFPHLALTVDSKDKNIMIKPPRSPDEKVVSSWMKKMILIVSFVGGLLALTVFIYIYKSTGNLRLAQSVTFATLGINSLIYVYSVRALTKPLWKSSPFANRWLNLAVVVGLVFQIFPFVSSWGRSFFKLEVLSLNHWGLVLATSILVFITIEVSKIVFMSKSQVEV
jgi:P-type Ca2+ transporter type 2C